MSKNKRKNSKEDENEDDDEKETKSKKKAKKDSSDELKKQTYFEYTPGEFPVKTQEHPMILKETMAYIVHTPEDFVQLRFLKRDVDKHYVCATLELAKAKKKQMQHDCALNFFYWLHKVRDKIKVKGSPKKPKGSKYYYIDIEPIRSYVCYIGFHEQEQAELFAQWIKDFAAKKITEFDELAKKMCLSFLRPDIYIHQATTLSEI